MRGEYNCKEVFLRLPWRVVYHSVSIYPVYICVFLHESADEYTTLLPTQPPFSWLILDFLNQTRGSTWKRSKISFSVDMTIPWSDNNLTKSGDVTAGARWASGNDASAPKPCLNPESSSDESFVRSNAVVQTSVIVWYLLYQHFCTWTGCYTRSIF